MPIHIDRPVAHDLKELGVPFDDRVIIEQALGTDVVTVQQLVDMKLFGRRR